MWILLLLLPQESLEQRRDRLAAKAEEVRGLKFKQPLPVRSGTKREATQAALESAQIHYGADLEAAGRVFKALGLIPLRLNLQTAITAGGSIGTQSVYSRGELLILEPGMDDFAFYYKVIQGLTDQNFPEAELRKAAGGSVDAQLAITALRSGDADLCKNLFGSGRKLDEKMPEEWLDGMIRGADKWEKEESKFRSSILPRLFVRVGDFGFRRGGIFAETLRREKGMDALTAAYRKPPASTEQILHPKKYLDGEAPVAIDLSALETALVSDGYALLYKTTLGELMTAILLETHFKNEDLTAASAGWAGDTLVCYEGKGQGFVVWATEWDSEADAEEFRVQVQRVANALLPPDDRMNIVVRRKTSVAFVGPAPKAVQDAVFGKLWSCKRKGAKESTYGD